MRRIYLAHAYLNQTYGRELQSKIEALDIEVINPFLTGEQQVYDKTLKENRPLTKEESGIIVKGDLNQIIRCQSLVAIMDGTPTIGTSMEIFYNSYYLYRKTFCLYTIEKGAVCDVVVSVDGHCHRNGVNQIQVNERHPWIEFFCDVSYNEEALLKRLDEWRTCI